MEARLPADEDRALAAAWAAAALRPGVADALDAVEIMIADAIEARAPVCRTSGRCCSFEKFGHRLYVTGLEAARTVGRLAETRAGDGSLTPGSLTRAIADGGCPFQIEKLCGVHRVRPLGCRIFFCDESAQGWQHDLSERVLRAVRRVHDEHGVEYRYGEWRRMLGMFVGGGRTEERRE